jgi:hypothetical protein
MWSWGMDPIHLSEVTIAAFCNNGDLLSDSVKAGKYLTSCVSSCNAELVWDVYYYFHIV